MTMDEIFWGNVDIKDDNDCQEWLGGTSKGYGVLSYNKGKISAHRYALLRAEYNTSTDLVLHHCDNPPCCNPNHLYRGDYASNLADKIRRNPNNPSKRLKNGEVWLIRRLLSTGISISYIGNMFKTSPGNICSIREGTRYRGVEMCYLIPGTIDRTWTMEKYRTQPNKGA